MPRPQPTRTRPAPVIHKGHGAGVYSVVFLPDGNSIASSAQDETIRIWDVNSPSATSQSLIGHVGSVYSVACSSLGDLIASGSNDKTIRLWDPNTYLQVGKPLRGHTAGVYSVAFSYDGNFIASASSDQTIRLWSVQTRNPVSDPFRGHIGAVRSVAFYPNGGHIVSGSDDRTIRIWDTEYGRMVIGTLQGHTGGVQSVAVSPDGSQLISGSDDQTLRLWDTRSGTTIGKPFEGHTSFVRSVAFSPDGMYIASGSQDRIVCVWDVRIGRQLSGPYREHAGSVRSVAFSPSGRHIASGSEDKTITIRDVSGLTSHQTGNLQDMNEDDWEPLEDDSTEQIGQHMSVQDMFYLLSRHGCADLSSEMDQNQNAAVLVSGGGFGDIWKGELFDKTRVAIKTWREALIKTGDYKTLKRAVREIHIWSKMKHENVHRLMGVIMFKGQSIGMVSEWMDNGNVHEYLQSNTNTDRFKLCIQVASGLAYIHSLKMVHGDMKAFNVLVSSDGSAKLTDFGISTMCESSIAFSATTTSQAWSVRWAAPELLSEALVKTSGSDVYALGMTILEIFTGTMPYPECPWDFSVMMKVSQGIPPTRPINHIKDDERGDRVWDLLISCWNRKPDARPSAKQIGELLILISSGYVKGEGQEATAAL